MEKTYQKLMEYNSIASSWLQKDKSNVNTKMAHAITMFGKRYIKYLKPYDDIVNDRNEKLQDEKVRFASEDDDKNISKLIVKNDKGEVTYTEYKYTRENQRLLNHAISQLNKDANDKIEKLLSTTLQIEPYYCTSIPYLTDIEKDAFGGIIISDADINTFTANGKFEKQLIK